MGRLPLSNQPDKHPALRKLNLPLKITGIVFWGMVLLAVIGSALLLTDIEDRIADNNHFAYQSALLSLSHIISHHQHVPAPPLKNKILNFGLLDTITGMQLLSETEKFVIGKYSSACQPKVAQLSSSTDDRLKNEYIVSICLPDEQEIIADYRKKILVVMAFLLMSFGYVLQLILKKLLTQPFRSIVYTANTILDGDTDSRFNEQRSDEFGFIAQFINKALDQQVQKTTELEGALKKIQETDDALHNERERATVTLNSLSEAVITTDNKCYIQSMNPSAEQLTGWGFKDAKDRPLKDILILKDDTTGEQIKLNPEKFLSEDNEGRCQIKARLDNGKVDIIDIDISVSTIFDDDKQTIGVVAVFQDITHAREMERRLSYQATHDWLTGLYNRQAFEGELKHSLETAWMNHDQHALCYIDLDQFKVVNDTCGHVAGDELIKQLAVLLKSKIRNTDVLARLGGDEFGIILPGCSLQQASKVVNQIHNAVKQFRFFWDEKTFEIGMSCGLVPITKDSTSATDIMTAADIACYSAKAKGKNNLYVIEEPGHDVQSRKRETNILVDLKDAITKNQFVLYYQSIVPVIHTNEKQLHLEILLRMKNKQGEVVSPGAFLQIAERYKMMIDIDKWVIVNLFKFIAEELDPNNNNYLFNINLSGATIGDPEMTDFIHQQLTDFAIPPEMICFEITETIAISDLNLALDFIVAMRQIGCHFALDDFGSGMCSFAYLKNLPVDYLKIDGSFVKEITNNNLDKELVSVVNSIGHLLGMKTVAEFVENDDIFNTLKSLDVDYAQGYGIHTPTELTADIIRTPALNKIS